MKYITYITLTILVLSSCVKNNSFQEPKTDIKAIEPFTSYNVPVKDGMTTIVTSGKDTLAVTSSAMTIFVPKSTITDGTMVVTYSIKDIYKNMSYGKYWQYLSFEDTKKGDYDYNDIVLHARITDDRVKVDGVYKRKHTISVQPVALGSAVNIKLGILYKKTSSDTEISEKILIDNCRSTLFKGIAYFPINTDKTKEVKKVTSKFSDFFELINDEHTFPIVWFIEASGQRMYAATSNFADAKLDMISTDGYPYGISLTQKWDYPVEKCHISKAYPGFEKWLTTGVESDLLKPKNSDYCFPASPAKNTGLPDLWDWEF